MIDFDALFASPNPGKALADIVAISLVDMEATLANHPSLYTYAATAYAVSRAAEAKAEVEVKRAKAYALRRLIAEGNTATAATSFVEFQDVVVTATDNWTNLVARTTILRALVDGLEHRKEMLINLAARTRRVT